MNRHLNDNHIALYCVYSFVFSSTASWPLTPPADPQGWRHIRIKLTGPNASGHTNYLSLSGLEIYGEIRGLADDELG